LMTSTPDPQKPAPAKASRKRVPSPQAMPVLEQLAAWYPRLFGAVFLPLKRGIFQDIMQAHPGHFDEAALKSALALHTRSTRYLAVVADGQQRHDLDGHPVEAMAPEHVHHALLEVHRRRQARSKEDLTPALRRRLVQAFERSALAPDAYAALVRGRDAQANTLLDEALQEARDGAAKDEALLRAFEAGTRSERDFADMYGLQENKVAQSLARARRVRSRSAP
jgi:ProP effector